MGYATDLTDKQWNMIEPIFRSNKGQHFVEHSKRDLINAVLYLAKAGCQWHLLPNDFPPYKTVFSFYSRAVKSGKWEKAMDLMVKKVREEAVSEQLGLGGDISKRIKPDFEVLPKRWVVERTFSWGNHSRRISKDFEIKIQHEENMFMISHLHTLLKRY